MVTTNDLEMPFYMLFWDKLLQKYSLEGGVLSGIIIAFCLFIVYFYLPFSFFKFIEYLLRMSDNQIGVY